MAAASTLHPPKMATPSASAISRAFASIAWIAIWNRDLSSKHGEDKEDDHGVLYFNALHDGLAANAAGSPSAYDNDAHSRKVGLAQGLVDFTRTLANGNKASVRSVHSARQRMMFIEPEPGFVLNVVSVLVGLMYFLI